MSNHGHDAQASSAGRLFRTGEAPLPPVRRARGYRLYTEDGRRLLDLYLDGGAALLGHRPELLGRALKNVAGRGLLGNLPSSYPDRLRRLLRQALPGHAWVGIAATADDALGLLRGRLGEALAPPLQVADPLSEPNWHEAQVAWWRPLCAEQPAGGAWLAHGPAALLHRLPFAVGAGPVTVSAREGGTGECATAPDVSPLLLAGAAAALRQLLRTAAERGAVASVWPPAAPGWRRSGVYVMADYPPHRHQAVRGAFLTAGVLLNPRYPGPSILPGTVSPGEAALLRRLFATQPGNLQS